MLVAQPFQPFCENERLLEPYFPVYHCQKAYKQPRFTGLRLPHTLPERSMLLNGGCGENHGSHGGLLFRGLTTRG